MNHFKKTLLKEHDKNGNIKVVMVGKDYLVKSFVALNSWFVAKCVDMDSTKAYFEPTDLAKKQFPHLDKNHNSVFSRELVNINLSVKPF